MTNTALRADIDDVTRQVWHNVLELPVETGGAHSAPLLTASSVQILGEWNGAVVLTMTPRLATTIAASMFCMDPDELGDDDTSDAVGEMANMIGGNIKSLLPGPSQLSMPTVSSGDTEPVFPEGDVVERLEFTACGEPFNVTLICKRGEGECADDTERTDG